MAKRSSKPAALTADLRVVVLHGKDPYLRSLKTDALREAIEATGEETDVIRLDGAATPLADVLDECRSFGLLQQHKLVVVDNAETLIKDPAEKSARQARPRDLVQAYAESPCESATLVLRAETWRKGNLDKAIEKIGAVVKCDPPNADKAVGWAVARAAKRYGVSLERDAAVSLIEQKGTSLGAIDTELSKLATAAGEGQPITAELVKELVGLSREQTVWAIQETILGGDPGTVLRELQNLLTISRAPTVLIRFALSDLARKVHGICAGLAGGTPRPEIDSTLRLWAAKGQLYAAAERLSPAEAADLLHAAVEADRAGKSGGGDEVRGIETLAIRFTRTLAG